VRRIAGLRGLPPRVAWFYFRARRSAARTGDQWSLGSATKPESLALLLRLARGRRAVVEIGTGTAWTTAALALADRERRVISFDPIERPERETYLDLSGARERIELRAQGGEAGPAPGDPPADFELTIATFEAWRQALAPGGTIAFHDYGNELYPGVTEAIEELGLTGTVARDVFVWRAT
jgi:predicted O-methyltransferase YrrM